MGAVEEFILPIESGQGRGVADDDLQQGGHFVEGSPGYNDGLIAE